MTYTTYEFEFCKVFKVVVKAFNYEEARILAQAEAIKNGINYKNITSACRPDMRYTLHYDLLLEQCEQG